MILITSAAYVTPGLASEFGIMPPSMLPLQNRRLYVHQYNLLKSMEEDIIISFPETYELPSYDKVQLEKMGIEVVFAPTKLSLGASIVYVLSILNRFTEPLRILHGDTLIGKIPATLDTCSVSKAKDNYNWAQVDEKSGDVVYTGYFSFTSQPHLIRFITEENYSFVEGVKKYRNLHKMTDVPTDQWFDFGLVNSYYRSKSQLTTQRSFNDLKIDGYSVIKRSKDVNKMEAESNWFKSIPKELKHFTPALWDAGVKDGMGYYEIEYFYLSSLAELFVFGNNPVFVWKNILNSCADFLDIVGKIKPDNTKDIAQRSVTLYRSKTIERLEKYCKAEGLDMNHIWCINGEQVPSLSQIVDEISLELDEPKEEFVSLSHGDFCFSNILFDFKSLSIKVLDPRGRDLDGNLSTFGDFRYDVAKLAHSVVGWYDYIIGGFFDCHKQDKYSLSLSFPTGDMQESLKAYFLSLKFAGFSTDELSVYPVMIHLFLSMLPLHSDRPDRQQAMLANALRLYVEYKNQK